MLIVKLLVWSVKMLIRLAPISSLRLGLINPTFREISADVFSQAAAFAGASKGVFAISIFEEADFIAEGGKSDRHLFWRKRSHWV